MDRKPILCLDFDGVIHSYESGWKGANVIPDPPVDGAILWIMKAVDHFDVQIFSSRTNQSGGVKAMQAYMFKHILRAIVDAPSDKVAEDMAREYAYEIIKWPVEKPPAMVTIDDRALTFTGVFPSIEDLKAFQPWNKGGDFEQPQISVTQDMVERFVAWFQSEYPDQNIDARHVFRSALMCVPKSALKK